MQTLAQARPPGRASACSWHLGPGLRPHTCLCSISASRWVVTAFPLLLRKRRAAPSAAPRSETRTRRLEAASCAGDGAWRPRSLLGGRTGGGEGGGASGAAMQKGRLATLPTAARPRRGRRSSGMAIVSRSTARWYVELLANDGLALPEGAGVVGTELPPCSSLTPPAGEDLPLAFELGLSGDCPKLGTAPEC